MVFEIANKLFAVNVDIRTKISDTLIMTENEFIKKIKKLLKMNLTTAKTTAKFTFPVQLTPDDNDGGYTVTFPDLPEAITQGDCIIQCLTEAVDCLEEAIAARIDDNLPIPQPSLPKLGEYLVELPPTMVFKALLYLGLTENPLKS